MSARILVIDDSEHLNCILKLTLEFKGYEVFAAENGLEGLETVKIKGPFDLILCDIEMPVMNGVEFVRRYRTETGLATPIIMLTAEGTELISHALASGATAAILKPFEPIQLMNEIEKYLN
jgi:two-component system chemotaxis response regulator CheY